MSKRVIIVVMGGIGIGQAPGAGAAHLDGVNTLRNLSLLFPGGLQLANLGRLGLGNLAEICGVQAEPAPIAAWGRCISRYRWKEHAQALREIVGLHEPQDGGILSKFSEAEYQVAGIGDIGQILGCQGFTTEIHTPNNEHSLLATLMQINELGDGLLITSLSDTLTVHCENRDVVGFRSSLEEFDCHLANIIRALHKDDLFMALGDCGCDVANKEARDTEECVPIFAFSKRMKSGVELGMLDSLADVAATAAEWFSLPAPAGKSFLAQLRIS